MSHHTFFHCVLRCSSEPFPLGSHCQSQNDMLRSTAWIRNILAKGIWQMAQSPVDGAVLGSSGNFRAWDSARESRPLKAWLKITPCPWFLAYSLLPVCHKDLQSPGNMEPSLNALKTMNPNKSLCLSGILFPLIKALTNSLIEIFFILSSYGQMQVHFSQKTG